MGVAEGFDHDSVATFEKIFRTEGFKARNPRRCCGRGPEAFDDEEHLSDLLSTSLRFQGFEVETATNRLQSLSKAESFDPELILLDVLMPDIDGLEVCRRLRSVGNTVPVIFLTARDTKADLLAGFTIGGDDYITKPFSLEEVVAWIRAVDISNVERANARRPGSVRQ